MKEPIAQLDRVRLSYQEQLAETLAVSDLSFTVYEGEFVSIVGPSGCGKTTVLSLLMGLIQPSGGDGEIFPLLQLDGAKSVKLFGEEIAVRARIINFKGLSSHADRDHLLDWRTVEENVLLSLQVKHLCTPERRAHARQLLETYGLSAFAGHFPRQLSGGMRQKVALIRTLAFDPKLLLLDEPFSALDYQTRLRVADEIYSIIRTEHKTAILVTHDIAEAISLSDRILVFSDRPARLKTEHRVCLSQDGPPSRRRSAKEFSELFDTIWKELEHHGV